MFELDITQPLTILWISFIIAAAIFIVKTA
jgi:hypothetical protein